MIDWILSHYEILISGLLVIISIITFILRKKSVLIDNSASSTLIDLVKEAENKFGSGHGNEKLDYVICKYFDILKIPASEQHWLYLIVKDIIEKILSTPQKK